MIDLRFNYGPPGFIAQMREQARLESALRRGSVLAMVKFCFYCGKFGLQRESTAVVHDARLCVHVCEDHRRWRETTSRLFGHSEGCPERSIFERKP